MVDGAWAAMLVAHLALRSTVNASYVSMRHMHHWPQLTHVQPLSKQLELNPGFLPCG